MKKYFVLSFLLILFTFGCGSKDIVWVHSYQMALQEAKKVSKPIFVDVYAEWCQWCHVLDKDVYTDREFIRFMNGYVTAKIDSEDNAEGTQFATKYKVEGLPTLMVIDQEEHVLLRIVGFRSAKDLIHEIETVQNLLNLEKTASSESATFELAKQYAQDQMYEEAEPRLKKIAQSSTASGAMKEEALFLLAQVKYHQDQVDQALATLNTYFANYSKGKSAQDALLLMAQLQLDKKENDKAANYMQQFLQRYPDSPDAPKVREVLAQLQQQPQPE